MTAPILREFTVSEVSLALKSLIEGNFAKIKVKGEISGLKTADSGHSYFSLKEGNAVLNAICWRHAVAKMQVKLEEGMEVICTGSLSSYPSRSIYQMNIEEVEVAGVGALLKLLEQRKEKLSLEGLFAPERKRKLPFLPKTIAVVTSPTGAVINDIIHRIQERFPVHILVWGVLVQGVDAAQQIADAINGLQNLSDDLPKPDLIIVARGGGSIEDLWAFNEEVVVRAAANSKIPLISAVGHETDTTLIDYASDKRAPTPTAAAEMAVPVRKDLIHVLNHYYNRELSSIRNIYRGAQNKLTQLALRMDGNKQMVSTMESIVEHQWQRLSFAIKRNFDGINNSLIQAQATLSADKMLYKHALLSTQLESWSQRLYKSMEQRLTYESSNLDSLSNLLQSYSPASVLKRGFAIIQTKGDKVLNGVKSLSSGDVIGITMHDGTINASVVSSTSASLKKRPPTTFKQKSLF